MKMHAVDERRTNWKKIVCLCGKVFKNYLYVSDTFKKRHVTCKVCRDRMDQENRLNKNRRRREARARAKALVHRNKYLIKASRLLYGCAPQDVPEFKPVQTEA